MATAAGAYDLLQCSICLEKLKSPRALPCLHSFCETCLQQHVKVSKDSATMKMTFPCPTCRKPSYIPKDGIKGFPLDFRVNQLADVLKSVALENDHIHLACEFCKGDALVEKYCTDCKKYFCKTCGVKHTISSVLKSHTLFDATDIDGKIPMCKKHQKEPIKFFCKSCDMEICLFCVLGDHEHHRIASNEEMETLKKNELVACLTHIISQISFLNMHIFDITCKEGRARSKFIEEKMAHSAKYKMVSDQNSVEMSEFLENNYKTLSQNLKIQKDHCFEYLLQFKMIQNKLETIIKSGNTRLLTDSHFQILQEIQQIDVRHDIDRFVTGLNPFKGKSKTIEFLRALDYQNSSNQKFNSLNMGDNPRNNILCKGDKSLQKTVTNDHSFYICNRNGIKHHLQMETYNPFKYQSNSSQKLKLMFKVGHKHPETSLNLPFGITFVKNDTLVVAENGNGRIQKFNIDGKLTESFKLKSGYPRCVASGQNQELYIIDEHNKCVKRISKKDEFKINQSEGCLHFPYGITCLSNGNLAVSDMIYERLSIIKPTGELVIQFGCHGSNDWNFDNPSYLTSDNEHIYISDSGHHQVKVFDYSGRFLHKMGKYGSRKGEFKYPKGIAISSQGEIIVADSGNNRVVMFSKSGDFLTTLLDINDDIDRPIDVACSPTGLLGVAIPDKNQVIVYKLNASLRHS